MTRISHLGAIYVLLLLFACDEHKHQDKIFWIDPPSSPENDFLFMAESTNVPPISSDSLIYYLTEQEFLSAEKLTFKYFGDIHHTDRYTLFVLLRQGSDVGRDYCFILRTVSLSGKVIDSYELAHWVESKNKHCFGSINRELIIHRTCDNGSKDIHQILSDGRIVPTSSSKAN